MESPTADVWATAPCRHCWQHGCQLSLSSSMLAHLLQLWAAPGGAAFLAQESPGVCPHLSTEKLTYLSQSQKRQRLWYVPEIPLRRKLWCSGQRLLELPTVVRQWICSHSATQHLQHPLGDAKWESRETTGRVRGNSQRNLLVWNSWNIFSLNQSVQGSKHAVMLVPRGM